METIPANRRRFSRVHFSTSGRLLAAPGREYAVEVLDLALRGALVAFPGTPAVQVGQTCVLLAALGEADDGDDGISEEGADNVIRMSARVARVQQQEVGLRCVEIDLDSMTRLRRLLELNLGDESLLRRELEHLDAARE
jgi:hypothetical protein